MKELVRKVFSSQPQAGCVRGKHISEHGDQPCFWPSTREMPVKQGLCNFKRLLLSQNDSSTWPSVPSFNLNLQGVFQSSLPICQKHLLLPSRFLLWDLANMSPTTYTPPPIKHDSRLLHSLHKACFPTLNSTSLWSLLWSLFPQSHLLVWFHIRRDCLGLLSRSLKCWDHPLTWLTWGVCTVDILEERPMLYMYVVCLLRVLAPGDSTPESTSGEVLSYAMWI